MRKAIILLFMIIVNSTYSFSQSANYYINHKNKVFSITFSDDEYEAEQNQILVECYRYVNKFYNIDSLPNLYVINYFNRSIAPTLSYDILPGWIIQRNGEEGDIPEYKCGLRIECSSNINSTIRLLDYGINNLDSIIEYTDSLLSVKGPHKPLKSSVPKSVIDSALNRDLSKKKESYILNATRRYKRKF